PRARCTATSACASGWGPVTRGWRRNGSRSRSGCTARCCASRSLRALPRGTWTTWPPCCARWSRRARSGARQRGTDTSKYRRNEDMKDGPAPGRQGSEGTMSEQGPGEPVLVAVDFTADELRLLLTDLDGRELARER